MHQRLQKMTEQIATTGYACPVGRKLQIASPVPGFNKYRFIPPAPAGTHL